MQCGSLIAWRKLLRLTQQDAAGRLGISLRQYGSYERGKSPIPPKIELATAALAASAAEIKPRRDGRFKPPPEGKYLRIFRARDGMELTDRIQDNATPRERRQPGFGYIKSLEFAQQRYSQWPCVSAEDRGDHYALTLDCP